MSTKDVILSIITDVAPDADPGDLREDADLRDELDIDSMDFLNILVAVAERLGVEVPERDYDQVRTLQGLVGYIEPRRPER